MRVIFSNYDEPRNPHYAGGGAMAIHAVASRLDPCGDVLCASFPGCQKFSTHDRVFYVHVGPRRLPPKLAQLVYHFSLPLRLRRWTDHWDVWVENLTPPFSTACLQLFTRKPVVALAQLLPGECAARQYHLPFHWAERAGLRTYRYGIALTEPAKWRLLKCNPRMQVALIPNGVDADGLSDGSDRYILFIGRLAVAHKGIDMLLSAWARVAGRWGVKLVFAGEGHPADEREIQAMVDRLGVRGGVEFLGRVGGERKREAFRKAMFTVAPSRFEEVPLVVMEAFSWGLPVVLFDLPVHSWLPNDICVKVPPFDIGQLGDEVAMLAQDRERRRRMGARAREWSGRYTWDAVAGKYASFLNEVHEERKGRKQ